MREKLYKKFVKAKDKDVKEYYHKKYKQIRNKILSECRESEKLYFQNCKQYQKYVEGNKVTILKGSLLLC